MSRRKPPSSDTLLPDLHLWDRVRMTVTPLTSVQRDTHVASPAAMSASPVITGIRPADSALITQSAPVAWHDDAPLLRADKKRVKQGVLKPTIALDLHGHTAARAEAALTRFLQRARRDGHLWVEIITGHGRPSLYRADDMPDPDKGVLKRLLPLWLNDAANRTLIKRVIPAPNSRGGAVWVALQGDE